MNLRSEDEYKVSTDDMIFKGYDIEFDGYPHFKKFLEHNEWYDNSLDITKEDYWAVFRTALRIGFRLGLDAGHDEPHSDDTWREYWSQEK